MSNLSAYINVKLKDGRVATVYCHKEGHYDHVGKMLKKYYNSQSLAESLVFMGDISFLSEKTDCPKGHSFNEPVSGFSVFYYRDRGDLLKVKRGYSAMIHEDFSYLWNGNEWLALNSKQDDINNGFHNFDYEKTSEID